MGSPQDPATNNLYYGTDNRESRYKLQELMLLVIERCQFDRSFGVTKLNKILYYVDALAFARFGKPVTGSVYEKQQFGPVAYGSEKVRAKLINNGDATLSYSSGKLQRLVPRREADLSAFTSKEIKLVEDVIDEVEPLSTAEIVNSTHGRGWDAVEMYQRIPYEAIYLSDRPYTKRDIERAHELVEAGAWED